MHNLPSALTQAIQETSDSHLNAPVLDPHQRGLSVLGHLYDFCRANAMLVEWARGLPAEGTQEEEIMRDWMENRGDKAKIIEPFFAEIYQAGTLDMSMLIIAEQRLRSLYGG